MNYSLPTSVEVCGTEYEIRSDYRAILDICIALNDQELTEQDRAEVALSIFYPAYGGCEQDKGNGDIETITMPSEHYREALERCYRFIDCDKESPKEQKKTPQLVHWEKDFQYIVAPINRATGTEIRSLPYMHWWTFISAYMEIGDCLFAQIVNIRRKKAQNKKLDKSELEWYRQNRDLVDIETQYTDTEKNVLALWGGV